MSAAKIRRSNTKYRRRYDVEAFGYSVKNSQLGNVCLARVRTSVYNHTLGMSHRGTVKVLINSRFEDLQSKDLLFKGLVTLLGILRNMCWIPIDNT